MNLSELYMRIQHERPTRDDGISIHLLPRIKHKQTFNNIVRYNNDTLVYSFKRAENH
jgi:hypothetical protein